MKLWYIYTIEYYSAIQWNKFESVELRCMNLEPVIQSEILCSYSNKVIVFSFVISASNNLGKKMRYKINGWMDEWAIAT